MTGTSDRIEKRVVLQAAPARVWRAVADAREFGEWFGVQLAGAFSPGATVRGVLTDVEERAVEVQKFQAAAGIAPSPVDVPKDEIVFCTVERVEPERYLSFRWHPYALEPGVDPAREPTTLVEFELTAQGGGTLLVIRESGFDALTPERRARAFPMNDHGWTVQAENVRRYVDGA